MRKKSSEEKEASFKLRFIKLFEKHISRDPPSTKILFLCRLLVPISCTCMMGIRSALAMLFILTDLDRYLIQGTCFLVAAPLFLYT